MSRHSTVLKRIVDSMMGVFDHYIKNGRLEI